MWVVAGSLDFGVITFGIRSRWFLDTGGTLPARERCAKPVVRRWLTRDLRPECCLLTTPNQALTQSTRRLALSSSP
jgi:hypothetical protein